MSWTIWLPGTLFVLSIIIIFVLFVMFRIRKGYLWPEDDRIRLRRRALSLAVIIFLIPFGMAMLTVSAINFNDLHKEPPAIVLGAFLFDINRLI